VADVQVVVVVDVVDAEDVEDKTTFHFIFLYELRMINAQLKNEISLIFKNYTDIYLS